MEMIGVAKKLLHEYQGTIILFGMFLNMTLTIVA